MIRFLLNQQPVSVQLESPELTVLEYLRETCNKCGTKEGCASGDCGACTVVIASAVAGELVYEAVNACITFAGSLHGKQLITVEDLVDAGKLHPVQQALYDLHGSQCGFCTPGFIMSMFAMFKNIGSGRQSAPADGNWIPQIETCLGGNLCRCTGYRPIVDACLRAIEVAASPSSCAQDQFDRHAATTLAALASINSASLPDPQAASGQTFCLPQSLDELDTVLQACPAARLLAGGTDLALEVTQQLGRFEKVICLQQLPALSVLEISDHDCTIGAGVNLSRCMRSLGEVFPDLQHLLHRFGSTQVRNQGTVGGNIANASPIGDLPPVLLALDATLQLRSAAGERELPLVAFFSDYKVTALQAGEYIRSVRIDGIHRYVGAGASSRLKIYKISKRLDDDISAVCAAFSVTLDGKQIKSVNAAFGGMAAIPKRATALEAVLTGQQLSPSLLTAARDALASDFNPISDARASAHYRQLVAGNLLQRLFLELAPDTPAGTLTQVTDYA